MTAALGLALVLSAAEAAPPGYEPRGIAHGCTLSLGPTESDGVVPMWAACRWADRTAGDIAAFLDDPTAHTALARVSAAEVLERHDDHLVVWQRHHVGLVADREVVVDWETAPEGAGRAWRWRSRPYAELPLVDGDAVCTRWEGAWTVEPHAAGGVSVVFDNRYDPGEYPAWLVRPFLASQLAAVVGSLRTATQP